jgi:hypothetical protein
MVGASGKYERKSDKMARIKGLVKTFRGVRTKLQQGVPEDEVDDFRRFIQNTIDTVEAICSKNGASPDELPHQSRNAYHFLKNLDLDKLPIIKKDLSTSRRERQSIKIRNVIKNGDAFIQILSEKAFELENSVDALRRIHEQIQHTVHRIDEICQKSGASPGMLDTPSRNAYCFMKFLTSNSYLQRHLQTLCRAIRLANSMRPSQEKRKVIVQLVPMRDIYRTKNYSNAMLIKLNEGLINADDEVLSTIFRDIFHGKSKLDRRVILGYVESESFCAVLYELDSMAGLTECDSKGRVFDLNSVFDKVNREYFDGKMEKPLCHWNRTLTLAKFGHYQPSRDRVMISVTFDDENVPPFVVEFVMYHELLHKKRGARWNNGKRYVHTKNFREEERKFKYFREAEAFLKKLVKQQRATLLA